MTGRQAWPAFDRGRRFHRRQDQRSAVGRNEGRADESGRSSAGGALARRQRQGRRRQNAGHAGRRTSAQQAYFADVADQGRAADVQGARQAVRAGVLVARSRRQPAQPGRQPQQPDPRHQRPDLARQHPERRRQPRAIAQGARRSRPRRDHRRDRHPPTTASRRSRRRARPVRRQGRATRTRRRISCRWASSPSILPRRWTCRCTIPTTRTRRCRQPHPKAGNGVLGRTPQSPISWSPPMAAQT